MPLYFRADTRNPKDILRLGFTPLSPELSPIGNWWKRGLRPIPSADQVSDVVNAHVVCMSTKLESAAIFPVQYNFYQELTGKYSDETYLYAIALPEAVLPKDDGSFQPIDVYDMHKHQVNEAKKIWGVNKANTLGFVTQALAGYEAFAKEIKPENVVGAIKCYRSPLLRESAGVGVYTGESHFNAPFERTFSLDKEMVINPRLNQKRWKKETNDAIEAFKTAYVKGPQKTTSILEGIKSSGIPFTQADLVQSRLGWVRLQRREYKEFVVSLFRSAQNVMMAPWELCKRAAWYLTPRWESNFTITVQPRDHYFEPLEELSDFRLASEIAKGSKNLLLGYDKYKDDPKITFTNNQDKPQQTDYSNAPSTRPAC